MEKLRKIKLNKGRAFHLSKIASNFKLFGEFNKYTFCYYALNNKMDAILKMSIFSKYSKYSQYSLPSTKRIQPSMIRKPPTIDFAIEYDGLTSLHSQESKCVTVLFLNCEYSVMFPPVSFVEFPANTGHKKDR